MPPQCKPVSAGSPWSRCGGCSLTRSPAVPPQELLQDGKRETTVSQLLINPTDLDIGRVFTCRSVNEATPTGKETSIELDVHRERGSCRGAGGRTGLGERVWGDLGEAPNADPAGAGGVGEARAGSQAALGSDPA